MGQPFQSSYIELLKKTLIDYFNINSYEFHPLEIVNPNWKTSILFPIDKLLRLKNFAICKMKYVERENRLNGYDWPARAQTMIGLNRLNNIETCIHTIYNENIPGDLIETGAWRGGATILMRALLKELGLSDRKVWVADSFMGLPKPDPVKYPIDHSSKLHKQKFLSVSIEEIRSNFEKYDLLDDNVIFLQGWFKDTLPNAPIQKLSLLRLDGDMYESTYQALESLYMKLSIGGFIIVDDYNAIPYCKQAIDDYRNKYSIVDEIMEIDNEAIYWRKTI